MNQKSFYINCEKCGKRLIERLPNCLFRFLFGRRKGSGEPVVKMLINGSLKIRCLRSTCLHDNILTFFPPFEIVEKSPDRKSVV